MQVQNCLIVWIAWQMGRPSKSHKKWANSKEFAHPSTAIHGRCFNYIPALDSRLRILTVRWTSTGTGSRSKVPGWKR
jgi:hypothetical protein